MWRKTSSRLGHDHLFVIGLIEVTGGGFHGHDAQAQLVTAFLKAKADAPRAAQQFHCDVTALQMAATQGGGIFVTYFTSKGGILATAEGLRAQLGKAL